MKDALLESARVPSLGSAHASECHRLRQLLDMQTEVLAGIAHELNTPLNSIIGFAELLADGRAQSLSPEHKEFLKHILGGGRQLAALSKRLGDLTNLHSERPWRVQALNLQTLLADVCATLRMTLMRRRIEIDTQLSPALGLVYADEIAVKQLVYTLLWSAIQETAEGQQVSLLVTPEAPERFRIEVERPGPSVDEVALGHGVAALEEKVSAHGGFAGARVQADSVTRFVVLPHAH